MKNIINNDFSFSEELKDKLTNDYIKDSKNNIIRYALSKNPISTVTYDTSSEIDTNFVFSKVVKTLPVCNQKQSGRCWIFAGLNVLREIIAKKLDLKDFELSQNYVALFDKIEKCNYLMSSIIDLKDNEPNERVLMHLLHNGVSDGGQWDMFRNIVKKYGIVPKSAFNETYQSSATQESNFLINDLIREFSTHVNKSSISYEDSIELKNKYMKKIFNLLISSFGLPPSSFDFEYYDSKDNYHIKKGLTPLSFFDKYIGDEIDEYVSLINSPTKDKPFLKIYTINYLNNCIDGRRITHLNIPMNRMIELIKKQLDDDSIVWFGSDVSFYRNRQNGIWDNKAFDYLSSFGFDLIFDKEKMLDYHASVMNHAMCIVGYNEKDNKINRWKIENSWGKDVGFDGYYVMSDTWFNSFVYQAVIKKKYLSQEELNALNGDLIELDPWDPMGTLAD